MIIPEVAHDGPVRDSRGLPFAPGYAPEGASHAVTAPCLTCGEPAPVVPYAYATERPYGACPARDAEACVQRAQAKAAARRAAIRAEAEQAALAAAQAAAEPPLAPPRVPKRSRPSQARKTLLGAARERVSGPAAAEGGTA